ncbi:MAG: Sec-independent protein translocase protein TatB [Pseudomonadota bacterium]|nr:Sec-independent protein translocase protein TatB [Pseudomonadota bacterium]MEE3100756.1 Sec-independent protein translocase protein TatB [Pseudomonadota bacterium]
MFDIGWSELLIIGALALIVVGPKDLPGMLRTLGQVVAKARRMARDFQRTMEDAADGSDFKDLRDVQKSMTDWNRKIGSGAPRKYAESFLNGEDKKPAAPAPGSLDAADAAANAQWEAEKAAAEAKARAAAADPAPAPAPAPETKGSA